MWPRAPRRRPKPKGGKAGPKPVMTPEGYLSADDVAGLLGVDTGYLVRHRRTLFGWLPLPHVLLREAGTGSARPMPAKVFWPMAETLAAVAHGGRPTYRMGWHPVPDVTPEVDVFVSAVGQRPCKVRFTTLPTFDTSEWLTDIEAALHAHFGQLAYLDTPSPCVAGIWPIRPADLG